MRLTAEAEYQAALQKHTRKMRAFEDRLSAWNNMLPGTRATKARPSQPKEPESPILMQLIPAPSSEEWIVLEQMCAILALAAQLTTVAEGEAYPTLGVSTVMIRRLISELARPVVVGAVAQSEFVERPSVAAFRQVLRRAVMSRFADVSPLALVACVLDVRSKRMVDQLRAGFTSDDRERAYSHLSELVTERMGDSVGPTDSAGVSTVVSTIRSSRGRARNQGHISMGAQLRSLDDFISGEMQVRHGSWFLRYPFSDASDVGPTATSGEPLWACEGLAGVHSSPHFFRENRPSEGVAANGISLPSHRTCGSHRVSSARYFSPE